ncbi:MAG: outer membrane beta-barrel protein [Synechococcales cyanobacterium RM1_1_8]|nr:outer membrane beta-barrel protein [Synechococcales cyanobacterium RM1_1_8]
MAPSRLVRSGLRSFGRCALGAFSLGAFSLVATSAQAQTAPSPKPTGWYGSISPGAGFGYSVDIESESFEIEVDPIDPGFGLPPIVVAPIPVEPIDISVKTDTGFAISGALGYQFRDARAELELSYNRNNVSGVDTDGFGNLANASGRFDVWSLSANGYYDIPTGTAFRPYIGGGVGIARLTADDVNVGVPALGTASLDGSGISAIFQAKAGLAYDISPNASVFLGYRLQGLPGQNFTVADIENVGDVDFDANTILIHSLQLGGAWRF